MTSDNYAGAGEAQARKRNRRYWLAMLIPTVAAIALLEIARQTIGGGEGGIEMLQNPAMAIFIVAIVAIGTLVAAIWQHRVIDEQEERAMLWGNSVMVYCIIVAGFAADILTWAGLVPAIPHMGIIIACMIPGFAVMLWLRFR